MIFFFNDTATTEIYTLSLHDALPIYPLYKRSTFLDSKEWTLIVLENLGRCAAMTKRRGAGSHGDRKSTRLNSSHLVISYAVFCLKKKKARYLITTLHRPHSACIFQIE